MIISIQRQFIRTDSAVEVTRMLLRIATLIALAAALVLAAAPKNRDWQAGNLLDAEHNAYFGGGHGSPEDTPFRDALTGSEFHFTTLPTANNPVLDHYVIESETDVYLVERMRFRSSKPSSLIANRPVKFAISKNKLWLLDAGSVELQTNIVKRKAKLQPTQ
jgi:hypothetical protein